MKPFWLISVYFWLIFKTWCFDHLLWIFTWSSRTSLNSLNFNVKSLLCLRYVFITSRDLPSNLPVSLLFSSMSETSIPKSMLLLLAMLSGEFVGWATSLSRRKETTVRWHEGFRKDSLQNTFIYIKYIVEPQIWWNTHHLWRKKS